MKEETVSSRVLYEGRIVTLRLERVRLDNGAETDREIVSSRGAVAIVAWNPQGKLLLVRQFRKATGQELWELPAGTLEPGEDPLHCAARELEEETGYRASHLRPIASFFTSPGFASERLSLFEAEGVSVGRIAHESDERITLGSVSLAEALSMIRTGGIQDAKTIIGVLLAECARKGAI